MISAGREAIGIPASVQHKSRDRVGHYIHDSPQEPHLNHLSDSEHAHESQTQRHATDAAAVEPHLVITVVLRAPSALSLLWGTEMLRTGHLLTSPRHPRRHP